MNDGARPQVDTKRLDIYRNTAHIQNIGSKLKKLIVIFGFQIFGRKKPKTSLIPA